MEFELILINNQKYERNAQPNLLRCLTTSSRVIRPRPRVQVLFNSPLHRNLALLHLRVSILPFIVLLQNKQTTLVENGENLISAQPRISAHLE